MPTPDSDIDDQLRAAMKVLDGEVPSGYFEALPNLTLARLEDSSMQQGPSEFSTKQTASAPPPVTTQPSATPPSETENTEDSGLHDIRNLAQSTKQRLSSKRITTSPPVEDDIASSSAGWKAVALPQPAKMVSLPELAELPSKKEIKAAEKAAAKVQKAADVAADHATAKAALEAPVAAPAAATVPAPARQAFSLPSAQRKKSKGPLIALVGLGVAAAAGAAIFVTTQKSSDKAPAVALAQNAAPAPTATTTTAVAGAGAAAGSAAVSGDVQKAEDDVAKAQAEADAMRAQLAAQPPADATAAPAKTATPVKAPPITKKGHGASKLDTGVTKPEETKQTTPPVDTSKTDKTKQKNADGSEPDFNDLLKEAGVDQNKHEQKPKLDKKSLTGDDFKNGMSAVTSKAQGCYKGTQGTATVKLVIAPSGQITKISVGGAFAGKPEATCVAAAIRGATFPPWDGGPMSFTYPILLSE